MPYPIIKALHFLGLALLLGGPVFAHFVGRERDREAPVPLNNVQWAMLGVGLLLFLWSGYLDLIRAATALWGELFPGDLQEFLFESRYGHVVLRKTGLALAFAAVAALRPASVWLRGLLAVLGGVLVFHISMTAHSASNGFLAYASDLIHVTALSVWGGGLLYFAAWRWPKSGEQDMAFLASTSRRFSVIGTVAVVALTATGAWMASKLIYAPPALTGTPYGLALVRKVAVFAALLGLGAANHFYFVPGLAQGRRDGRFLTLYRRSVRVEALLLLLIIVGTGFLTTNSPPKEPQALPAPMQQTGVVPAPELVAGDEIRYSLELVPNPSGSLTFELHLEDASGRPVSVEPPFMDLTMPDHLMPPYYSTMRAAGNGVYRNELILPMSGFWRIFIELELPGQGHRTLDDIVVEFRTAKSPRERQLEWYVSHYRVTRNFLGPLVFLWWSGFLALGIFGLRKAWREEAYKSLRIVAGLLVFFASWQVASMFIARGYPTEHKPNPVPVTTEAIEYGEQLFMANCAMCHGPDGTGFGPLRETMWPPPSDLTIYTSWHADGELYWFITKGVAGTNMPAFERTLTDEERWTIIHFLRTLPPREGPYADWYPGHRQYFLRQLNWFNYM